MKKRIKVEIQDRIKGIIRKIKNFFSYVWYVLSLDYFQLGCTIIDIAILVLSIIKREELLTGSYVWVFLAFLTNFVWQFFNIQSHFRFLHKEKSSEPLTYLYTSEKGGNDFSKVRVDGGLTTSDMPYIIDVEKGIMRNPSIDELLRGNAHIEVPLVDKKEDDTKDYIRQYKETLLIFLNHRWHEINFKGGQFDNESKLCFSSELYRDMNGAFKWAVCKGEYYNGCLTNDIFCRYIGGSQYSLYPPKNTSNAEIKSFSDSDFSDHLGVSTLLCTLDGHSVVFRQSNSSAQSPGLYTPSGSGSIDYADFKKGDDLRTIVIRAAERELLEESNMKKAVKEKKWDGKMSTQILAYLRNMERGGKPEFFCITRIDVSKEELSSNIIIPNTEELSEKDKHFPSLFNENDWIKLMPEASFALKMNYEIVKSMLNFKINLHGAELQNLQKGGREYLWNGDANYWGRRSPILFPIVGKVSGNVFCVEGKKYQMEQHGFARDSKFRKVGERYILDSCPSEKYPYLFELAVRYRTEGNRFYAEWTVTNKDTKNIHFQIGAHPALLLPDYHKEDQVHGYLQCFDGNGNVVKQPMLSHGLQDGYLTELKDPVPLSSVDKDGLLPITADTFANDALILEHGAVKSVALLDKNKQPYIKVGSDQTEAFGLWAPNKSGCPFVCLEPWCGITDPKDFSGEFKDRYLNHSLKPGGQFEFTYWIEVY